jgi:hypothetical protein
MVPSLFSDAKPRKYAGQDLFINGISGNPSQRSRCRNKIAAHKIEWFICRGSRDGEIEHAQRLARGVDLAGASEMRSLEVGGCAEQAFTERRP